MDLEALLEELWDINNYKIKNAKVYFRDVEIELEDYHEDSYSRAM